MRKVIALPLAVTGMLTASIAAAPPAHADATGFALSVNPPVGWATGDAVAGTASVGLTERHAIRLNAASYAPRPGLLSAFVEDSASYSGRITDLAIGWQYFPRALYHGMSLELDLLGRGHDTQVIEESGASRADLATESRTLAMRAQVAWTWRFEWLFVAAGVGLSYGYETGTETELPSYDGDDSKLMSRSVERFDLATEGFVRIGFVIEP